MKVDPKENELRKRIVGKFLRAHRVKAGLTQLDVANHLQYTTAQFISNWERGISMPPMDTLPRLATLLRIAPRDLIEVINDYQEQVLKLQKKQLMNLFKQYGRTA